VFAQEHTDLENQIEEIATLKGHSDYVESVTWSPNGMFLASGSNDVRMWDINNGQLLRIFEKGYKLWNESLAWSPDGSRLAGGTGDGIVVIWNVADGKVIETLAGHADEVTSVDWSPNGEMLLSGSRDGTLRVWDVADTSHLTPSP
jgi:WD40 repeat protein